MRRPNLLGAAARRNRPLLDWYLFSLQGMGARLLLSQQFRCDGRTTPPFAKDAKGTLKFKFRQYAGHGKAGAASLLCEIPSRITDPPEAYRVEIEKFTTIRASVSMGAPFL